MKLQDKPVMAGGPASASPKAATGTMNCASVPGADFDSPQSKARKAVAQRQSGGTVCVYPIATNGHNAHKMEADFGEPDLALDGLDQVNNVRLRFRCTDAGSLAGRGVMSVPDNRHEMVLMEVDLPNVSGIECVRKLKVLFPGMQIVAHTVSVDGNPFYPAAVTGTNGCLPRQAIRSARVDEGRSVNSAATLVRSVCPEFRAEERNGRLEGEPARLSRREEQILSCVAKGLINKEIAEVLAISLETVRSHLKNIYEKLHVRSRTEAVVKHWHELTG